VTDRQPALQRAQGRLVENLADQAELLVDHHVGAVADRDPGGLLAAVLQCVEPEVGELADVLVRRPHAEDAALLARALHVLPQVGVPIQVRVQVDLEGVHGV